MRRFCRLALLTTPLFALLAIGGCPAPTDVNGATDENGNPIDVGGGNSDNGNGGNDDGDAPDDFSAAFSGNPQKVTPFRDNLSREEAYHLLRRTSFGATPQQVDAAVARGLSATIDDLLEVKPVAGYITDLAASYEEDATKQWMVNLIESPNPLLERMTMFWHDRFATSYRVAGFRERNLPLQHWHMLRDNALGNYRQFLAELTLDPLMLLWLNGSDSPKDNPNENYCREFWELFTLGRDVLYTEQDIREGARAFTGTTLLYPRDEDPRPIFDIYNHDETTKSIFPDRATPENFNYLSVIDLTLAQPEAARYVARNLFVFFVHDHPSDEVVNRLAEDFVASGFEIKPLVREILRSQALFSSEARYNQVSSPVEHWIGVARTLDMHIYSERSQGYLFTQLVNDLRDAGQQVLDPPGVEGWTEGEAWLQDQWVMSRLDAFNRTMEFGDSRTERLPYHLLPPVEEWNQREVRRRIVEAMAGVFFLPLTEPEIDIYIEVLDQNGHEAFHLVDRQEWQEQYLFEMIRLMAMDERVITR